MDGCGLIANCKKCKLLQTGEQGGADMSDDLMRLNGRDIYECANQLEGYVDESTPERLAVFLLREGKAACELADEIVRLRALVTSGARVDG